MKIFKLALLSGIILIGGWTAGAQEVVTLEEALTIAFENSPDIQKSRLNMERNKELLDAQLAGLKSKFSLELTPFYYSNREEYFDYSSEWYTSENLGSRGSIIVSQPVKFTDGRLSLRNDFGYQNNYAEANDSKWRGYNNSLYLQYNQPLFTHNQTRMNLDRNRLNLENATLAYSIEMLNMERYVAQAFYSIYQKQMAYQIAVEDYNNQEVSMEIIRSKVEGGLSAKEELYQAELNLATSKSGKEDRLVDLENAKDQFKQLLGVSLFEDIEVSTDVDFLPVSVSLDKAIENGLSQRLELQQRQIDITNAEFDLIETSAYNEFRGDVGLSMGLMGNNEVFTDVYDKPTKSPSMEITLTVPIFDWGERKARIKAAELAVESSKIDMKTLETDIIINIRQVYRNLNNLIRQIEIAEQNEKNAQLTYDINLERYRNGDLTSMDLELFQNQLSEKKMNLANALINYKLELLNMKIQSLWDFENNTSFVPKELQENLKESNK